MPSRYNVRRGQARTCSRRWVYMYIFWIAIWRLVFPLLGRREIWFLWSVHRCQLMQWTLRWCLRRKLPLRCYFYPLPGKHILEKPRLWCVGAHKDKSSTKYDITMDLVKCIERLKYLSYIAFILRQDSCSDYDQYCGAGASPNPCDTSQDTCANSCGTSAPNGSCFCKKILWDQPECSTTSLLFVSLSPLK